MIKNFEKSLKHQKTLKLNFLQRNVQYLASQFKHPENTSHSDWTSTYGFEFKLAANGIEMTDGLKILGVTLDR